jgi:hypothetical protein
MPGCRVRGAYQQRCPGGFCMKDGMRFTQLSRLSYFNLVRSIAINSMHSLILGKWLLNYNISSLPSVLTDIFTGGRTCENTLLQFMDSMQDSSFNHKLKALHEILEKVILSPQIAPSALLKLKTFYSLNYLPTSYAYPPLLANC